MDEREIREALEAKEADLLEQMERLTRPEQDQGAISFGKRVGDGTAMAVDRLTAVGAHANLQEILDQPISLRADAEFKRGAATVEFWIDRAGNREDVLRGQGGSVTNILSVGLRMFALTTLDEKSHRRFLVLDEQDCWLRPDLVPRLVKIVHDAGQALGFQILMISHHEVALFERYADRIFQLSPHGDGTVEVRQVFEAAANQDPA